eukprot:6005262-Alexandrium_andersonii.AAC.1
MLGRLEARSGSKFQKERSLTRPAHHLDRRMHVKALPNHHGGRFKILHKKGATNTTSLLTCFAELRAQQVVRGSGCPV